MNLTKPKLGEVWEERSRVREEYSMPSKLYLLVSRTRYEQQAPPCDPPVFHEQHVLLDLVTGRVRRVNVRSLHHGNGWSRFRYRANKST